MSVLAGTYQQPAAHNVATLLIVLNRFHVGAIEPMADMSSGVPRITLLGAANASTVPVATHTRGYLTCRESGHCHRRDIDRRLA